MHQWPFEGREAELTALHAAFTGGAANAVVVRAPAGVGKTRLVREALARLGGRTLWIAATRAASAIPLAALTPLLPDDIDADTVTAPLLRAICRRVAEQGGRGRVVLGVDDAHLLDDASSAAIAAVIAAGAAFVVLTVRTGEPLADSLTRLGKENEALVLELPAMPAHVVDRLIDHGAPGPVPAEERRRLHASAGGNPLALRELLHGAVPGGLTDLVAARLDGVDAVTRGVVELVACGEPVPLSFVEGIAGSAAVTAAEESGLVVCDHDGNRVNARLEHPLFGEVLRERMAVTRARQACRDLAAQLLASPLRRRCDTLQVALWQVEGGLITRPELVLEGARQAIGRAGLGLAERLVRAAREAAPGPDADWLLAKVLAYQGRGGEAAALLPETPPERPSERARWAVARAEWLYWDRGDVDAATRLLDTAYGRPVVESARAFMLFFAGRCAEAARIARGVLDRHGAADAQGLVWAAAAGTAALGFLGRLDEAESLRAEGLAVAAAHEGDLPWAAFQVEIGACLAHLATGHADTAAAIAEAGYQASVRDGVTTMVGSWALYGGIAAATRGDLARADRLLDEAVAAFEHSDTFRLRRVCLAARAWVHALRGDGPAAAALMAEADELDNGTNAVFAPWTGIWKGWTAYANGDVEHAVAATAHAAELAAEANLPAIAAVARYETVRLGGRPSGAPDSDVPGPLAPLLAEAERALKAADESALGRTAEELAALGHRVPAAELATEAARVARRTGHRGRAALAASYAAELAAECGDVRTPLLGRRGISDLLTARERQVVLLAAGHTSRQIAERLGLAVATVNNTLARAYAKLGVTGREQLRRLLDESEG